MSLNRDQFAVVLAKLRSRVRNGDWVEGEPLPVGELAARAGVSATPIREALSQLAGEGLIQDRRGRGYHARRIDSAALADLYSAQIFLARTALAAASADGAKRAPFAPPAASDFITDSVKAWEGVFDGLVRRANSGFLMSAHQRLADQLAPARRVEPAVLGETPADFAPLVATLSTDDGRGVAAALDPFVQRRRARVDDLVMRLRLDAPRYKNAI